MRREKQACPAITGNKNSCLLYWASGLPRFAILLSEATGIPMMMLRYAWGPHGTRTTRKEGGAEPCQGGPIPRVAPEARGNTKTARSFLTPRKYLLSPGLCGLPGSKTDGTDPLGANSVVRRPHLAKVINEITGLQTSDPFRRTWTDSSRNIMVRSEAWGRNRNHDGEDHTSGERLVCSSHFVRNLLAKLADKELLAPCPPPV